MKFLQMVLSNTCVTPDGITPHLPALQSYKPGYFSKSLRAPLLRRDKF